MSCKIVTLIPVNGRDYRSPAAVMRDWNDGISFMTHPDGSYCSIQCVPLLRNLDVSRIYFCYQKMARVHILILQ